jgi:hypothetical protein
LYPSPSSIAPLASFTKPREVRRVSIDDIHCFAG